MVFKRTLLIRAMYYVKNNPAYLNKHRRGTVWTCKL